MYGQPSNEKLIIESVQYTAAIEIPRTNGEIYQLRLYNNLGLESLRFGR